MAKYKCPACGDVFNGKRCQSCYYEPFMEEIPHRLHTHKGEPLVIHAPVRKPIRRKDPFGCDRRTRKPSKALGVVVALVIALTGIVGDVIETHVDSFDTLFATPEPAPDFTVPEDAVILYSDGDITVRMDWQEGTAWPEELPLYLENNTGQELNVIAGNITVNGYVIDNAYLYDTASDRRIGLHRLCIEEDALAEAGITTIAEVSFRLRFYDDDTYESVAESDTIRLVTDAPADFVQPVDDSGTLLWEQDGIRVIYRGYRPDEYEPESISQAALLFYLENSTQKPLELWSEEVTVNQEQTYLSLWTQLPPGTRTIQQMYLYSLEDLDIHRPEEIQEFIITMSACEKENWETVVTSGPLPLDIAP